MVEMTMAPEIKGEEAMKMKIGFIGFGEAAYNLTAGLIGEGLNAVLAYDKYWNDDSRGELIRGRAEETGTTLLSSLQALVESCGMIISAVSADMAVELAESAKPFLKPDKLYVDVNAAAPMTKEKINSIISGDAMFVDCAIMGPVPPYRHKVPMLVCGDGAALFHETMTPYNMKISIMDSPAGGASASKMFRSIFVKGFVMLLMETLVAAHKYGIEDDILSSINKTIGTGSFLENINGLVTRGVIHSERREHEMAEVIATLDALQLDGIMSRATKEKLRWTTELGLREYFKGVPPEDFHEIFKPLEKILPA